MPTDTQSEIEQLSPDKLLTRFNKSGIVVCIIAAFALHVVVLGGTSVDYIHGIVDPVWKAEQDRLLAEARRQAEAERQARLDPGGAANQPASRPTTRPAAGKPTTKPKPPAHREVPKNLRDLPEPHELPVAPGRGIGIDETEGR